MMAKALAFVLSISVLGIAAIAQTPEPRQRIEPQVFSWTFGSTGGYLGIEMAEISNENLGKFGLSAVRGVGVEKVSAESPAERAGILAGDVIVRVNGEEVTSTQKLSRMIAEIAPDHTARITVLRGGSERELNVTIGKRPTPKFDQAGAFGRLEDLWKNEGRAEMPRLEELMRNLPKNGEPGVFIFSNRRQIGIGLMPLTKELAEHFGVEGGVMVSSVRADSPASRAGIKVGDIVTEIEGKPVRSDMDLIRGLAEKKDGSVTIGLARNGSRQTVTVTPEESKDELRQLYEFRRPDGPPPAPVRIAPMPPLSGAFGFPGRII